MRAYSTHSPVLLAGLAAGAPAVFDKTRFLAFYEARTAGNTLLQMQDLSGHGRHATRLSTDTGITQATDVNGRPVYRHAAANNSWRVPAVGTPAGDYTVYAYVRVTTASPTYFWDCTTDRTLAAMNTPDGYAYSGSFAVGQVDVVGLHRCCWQLNSGTGGAGFLLDNAVVKSGGFYVARALTSGSRLGSSEDGGFQIFQGDLIAFGLAAGNDTPAQRNATDAYFLTL